MPQESRNKGVADMEQFLAEHWTIHQQVREPWENLRDDTIAAAFYLPGFALHPYSWSLTIDREGFVRQIVEAPSEKRGKLSELQRFEQRVGGHVVSSVIKLAKEVKFRNMQSVDNAPMTDLETLHLAMRFDDGVKRVEAYGARYYAHLRRPDMVAFVRLWDFIHEYAPFQPAR